MMLNSILGAPCGDMGDHPNAARRLSDPLQDLESILTKANRQHGAGDLVTLRGFDRVEPFDSATKPPCRLQELVVKLDPYCVGIRSGGPVERPACSTRACAATARGEPVWSEGQLVQCRAHVADARGPAPGQPLAAAGRRRWFRAEATPAMTRRCQSSQSILHLGA